MIIFRPKFEDPDPDRDAEFSLILTKKQNYETVRNYFIPLLAHIIVAPRWR